LVLSLSCVLVISLAWRKVVVDCQLYHAGVDRTQRLRREKVIRQATICFCVLLYVGSAIIIVKLLYFSILAAIACLICAAIFARSMQQFGKEFSTSSARNATMASTRSTSLRIVHQVAKLANQQATIGVCFVFVMLMFLGYCSAMLGAPSQPMQNETANFAFFGAQLGMVLMNMSCVLYARNLRLMNSETKLLAKSKNFSDLRSFNGHMSMNPTSGSAIGTGADSSTLVGSTV
jgi:hypothetical protein